MLVERITKRIKKEMLPQCQRILQIFDNAGELSDKIFGKISSAQVIQQIAIRRERRLRENSDEFLTLDLAQKYAIINTYISQNELTNTRNLLEVLVDNDEPFKIIDGLMEIIGLDYVKCCLKVGRALSPRDLDEVLFPKYAPESPNTSTYHMQEGLAIVIPILPEGYEVFLLHEEFYQREVKEIKYGVTRTLTRTGLRESNFFSIDKLEDIYGLVAEKFSELNVDTYAKVVTPSMSFAEYLTLKFYIQRCGSSINQHTILGKNDMGFQYTIGMMQIAREGKQN